MFGTAFIPAMLVLFPAMVVLVSSAAAQNRDSPFRIEPQVIITPAPQPSPYQGFETREVKTLSTEKQEGLKRGSGLSYALAAEMNGYAGPLHVLELSEQLSLDADQKKRTQVIYDKMRREAVAAGEALIAAEAHLDRMFQMKHASYDRVEAQTSVIAGQEAKLRAIHLNAHLSMNEILTPDQRASYDRLRGYGSSLDGKPLQDNSGHSGHVPAPKP